MFSEFVMFESPNGDAQLAERLSFGETNGRNEAWLRDALLKTPEIIPIRQFGSLFGPLVPLCKELRTPVGPVDCAFINQHGLLTLVECKLWRNPESRRKVVSQILDYASAIASWTYSDLQREVSTATGRKGNVPYKLVRETHPLLPEHTFVDSVSAALSDGRCLLIVAGDGIREDVGAMAELLTRNVSRGFTFGLMEVALYGLANGGLAVQPRVLAKTAVIERTVVTVRSADGTRLPLQPAPAASGYDSDDADSIESGLSESPKQAEYRAWWQPVLDMRFDDPDQESPILYWPNHVRTPLPWNQTWLTSYRYGGSDGHVGVGTGGRDVAVKDLFAELGTDIKDILSELPEGTECRRSSNRDQPTLILTRNASDFRDDSEMRQWIIRNLNRFSNVLRRRLITAAKRRTADHL